MKNIFKELQKAVDKHMIAYQNDWEIDKSILQHNVESNPEPMIWLCRATGTHICPESEALLAGTYAYNMVQYFYDTEVNAIKAAYIIIPKENRNGELYGDVYPIQFSKEAAWFKRHVCNITSITVVLSDNSQEIINVKNETQFHNELKKISVREDVKTHFVCGNQHWKELVNQRINGRN